MNLSKSLSSTLSAIVRPVLASTLALFAVGCGAGNFASAPIAGANQVKLEGMVHGGQQPIVGAAVQLYAAGSTADQSAATPLIAAAPLTDAAGAFSITGLYTCPSITTEVYLIASGGNPGLAPGANNAQSVLMAALGPCGNLTSATHIIINEVTTVGSIYPITPYMANYLNVGAAPANQLTLASDFMQINEFIDTDGGQSPGPALPGGFTAPVNNLNSLANSISACINTAGGAAPGGVSDGTPCGNLFADAKPPAGTAPTNTADAVLDIANNPFQNVGSIYSLTTPAAPFQPVLAAAPADWTLKILPNLTLATPSNLVGVGSPTVGTLTLGQAAPAGGLTVNLVSSNTAAVTVTSPANIAAGSSSGTFNYIGVAAGTSTITGSATGYYGSSVTLSATSSLISLGTIPTVAPGQSVSLPLSLGTPAPAGGVTVNFTSSAPGVATVSGSSFIPAGLQIPASNPQVTGVTVGTATINATATGYAPGARNASVSVTATLPTTFTVPIGVADNEVLTISAPAPTGGIVFALTSGNNAIFTVPATVTVPAGATTVNIPIDGATGGTTTLYANSPNIPQATSSITVNGTINAATSIVTGQQLQTSSSFSFAANTPTPVTATVTSSNPAVAVVSTSPTVQGSAVASFPGLTNNGGSTYYLQGVSVGTATLTIAANGYTNATVSVTVDPSGFAIYSPGNFSTTTLSADTSISVLPAYLNPGTLAVLGYGTVTPAAGGVTVGVTSSNTAVGTITNSPIGFPGNSSSSTATFHPAGAGTSNITLVTPGGFSTPSVSQQITATVTATPINAATQVTTGQGMEISSTASLSQTPPTPTTMTITSSNPAVAVVSASATIAGSASISIPAIVNTGSQPYYVQGLAIGTTTLTISAPAYSSATVNITVDPSGFVIYSPGSFSTTTFSAPTTITFLPAILNPATLALLSYSQVNPQSAPVNLPFTSSNTAVGTITTSPMVFAAGATSGSTTFQPAGAGTSNLTVGTPAGFSTPTPTANNTIVATVTAPPIYAATTITAGNLMQTGSNVSLSQTPPTPVTVTLTSNAPAVATISGSATLAGAASYTFPNTVNTASLTFYVQGQSIGTSVITVSAPGYQSSTINVTVDPSGFVIYSPGNFSTTTFSTPTTVTVLPAVLNPSTLALLAYSTLNPAIGTVSVPVTSSAVQVGTVSTPLSFNGGSTSASFTFTPVAAGTTNLTIGVPANFSTPTPASNLQITATVTAPSIYAASTITTGLGMQMATNVSLSQTPPSPASITITSANTAIATISTSSTVVGSGTVVFPGVTNTASQTLYVQGQSIGSTTLTVSAPGFSNATVNITVDPSGFVIYSPGNFSTTTFSSPTTVTLLPAFLTPGTLTLAGYATVNPGIGSPAVVITSSSTSVGTVSTPVTFASGSSSGSFTFQPVGAGTTNLTLTQPAGFNASSTAQTQQITATVTAPPIYAAATITAGVNMQTNSNVSLGATPPAAVTVSILSSNAAVALVSTSPTVTGSAAINFPGVVNSGGLSYYVQGISVGTATLTVSAPGYITSTVNVTVDPSGFVIYSPGNFSTTTFSAPTSVTVLPAILSPNLFTLLAYGTLSPGVAAAVPVTSATPGVGTVTSPINFSGSSSSGTFAFQPIAGGSTVLSIGTPTGFTAPSQAASYQITATVSAPTINAAATVTTGALLQLASNASLAVTPPAAVSVTITSSNPAIATVSTSATVAGTASIVFAGVANTGGLSYYVQGQAVGTTTLTISAPGYTSSTVNITVDPAGFVFYSPGNFTTTAGGANTTITLIPAILSPGVLTVIGYADVNPGAGVSVPVGSTSPQIGSINTSSLFFAAGASSASFLFTPLQTGSTDIDIVSQPAGFTTPSQPVTQQIVVTVN